MFPGGLFGRGKVEGDHGDDQRTARILTDFVRRGGRLGLVCDLYDRTGVPVPFFGGQGGFFFFFFFFFFFKKKKKNLRVS